TFTASGSTGVTLSATIGGQTISQTVVLSAMTTTATSSQTLNFNTLGVSVSLTGFGATGTGSHLITDLTWASTDTIVPAAGSSSASFQVGANANQVIGLSIDSAMSNAVNGGNNFGQGGGFTNLATAVATFAASSNTSNAQSLI